MISVDSFVCVERKVCCSLIALVDCSFVIDIYYVGGYIKFKRWRVERAGI